jgi:hypothetical protein
MEKPTSRDPNRDRNRSKKTLSRVLVLPNVGSSQPTRAMDAMYATDATCKDVAAVPKPSGNAESLGRSDSLQAVLRWHEQGQKRLSIGLELECYLPDLGMGYGEHLVWEKFPKWPKSNCLILFISDHHDLSLLK